WRAEVVADCAQQCGLEGVASTERLGLQRRAGQPLAIVRRREQGCQRRQDALCRRRIDRASARKQAADVTRSDSEIEGELTALRPPEGSELDAGVAEAEHIPGAGGGALEPVGHAFGIEQ